MKRVDVIKQIRKIAKARGIAVEFSEGANHTHVTLGDKKTTIPRHKELRERTARGILDYLSKED